MQLTEYFFSITPVTVSTKSEVFLKDFFSKFEYIKTDGFMHSLMNKFLKVTLYFSGWFLFPKK